MQVRVLLGLLIRSKKIITLIGFYLIKNSIGKGIDKLLLIEINILNLITWNCNMAFRKKCQYIDIYNIDILVVQECESPERFNSVEHNLNYTDFIWYGDNIHKGIAIFSFNGYRIEIRKDHNPSFRYIIPIVISCLKATYNVYAIWAMPNASDRKLSYVGQILAGLDYYDDIGERNTILVGDFNSNAIWDGIKKHGNHADLIQQLNHVQVYSIYHRLLKEEHGEESIPTQYMYKHIDKPYHLDYCCMAENLYTSDLSIDIGEYGKWKPYSDHMPIIIRGIK